MKKKVLHVLSSRKYSGAENVAAYIIQNLKEEYDMVYTSPEGSIRECLKERGVEYISLKDFSISQIKKVIDDFKPDIIHAHDFTATVKCAILWSKIPVISHIHQNPNWLKKININSMVLRLISIRIKHLIAVAPAIVDSISSYSILNRKTTVIENTVDVKDINEKSQGEVTCKYDLIFIGRLVDVKDPLRFMKIVSGTVNRYPNLRACIIGDGELKDKCQQYIEDLNLENNIDLKGFISNPFPILKNSKILVMTSKSEGLPMTVIEGLALGKPVIASNIDGIERIIDDTCGFICDTDKKYINSILELLKDDEKYKLMSKFAKTKAEDMFSTRKYKHKMIEVYKHVSR